MPPRPATSAPLTSPAVELATSTPQAVAALRPALPGSELLTTAEVAELLRVDVYTVRRWVGRDELPAYRIGRELRIDNSDLTAWLDARRTRRVTA